MRIALGSERMAGRRDDHVGVRRERLARHVEFVRRTHHDREVGQVGGHLRQQLLAVVHREVDDHTLVPPDELHQQARKEVVAGADHRDVQLAARDALELRHRAFGQLELLDDPAADVEQFGAGRRQVDLLAELLEERKAGVVLELLDLGGDGRLRQVQLFGRARETQVPRDGFEDLQLAQRGVLHFNSNCTVRDELPVV